MKKWWFTIITLPFIYLLYGIFLANFELQIIPSKLSPSSPEGFYDYAGITNVHTQISTGTEPFKKVILAAQEAQLDYLFLTDLNNLKDLAEHEGVYGQLHVFVGGEYSFKNSRILAYDLNTQIFENNLGRLQMYLSDRLANSQASHDSLVLAHPYKLGYEWSGKLPKGLNGIEIINLKSQWQNSWLNSKASFFWTLFTYPLNSRLAFIRLFQFPKKEIQLWDDLNKVSKVHAYAGADAESKLRFFSSYLSFPSYQTLFSIVRNHVLLTSELTGNHKNDRQKIAAALKQGQFYVSLDLLANPKGFNAYIKSPQGDVLTMGSQASWEKGMELHVILPEKPNVPFETVLFRNGKRTINTNTKDSIFKIDRPGRYRVLVRVIPTLPLPDGKKWIPWIFSNPFYLDN